MVGIFSGRSSRLQGEIAIVCDEGGSRMTIYEDLEEVAQLGPFGEWGAGTEILSSPCFHHRVSGPVFGCTAGRLILGDHENNIHEASMSHLCLYPRALSFSELQVLSLITIT